MLPMMSRPTEVLIQGKDPSVGRRLEFARLSLCFRAFCCAGMVSRKVKRGISQQYFTGEDVRRAVQCL